MGVSLTCITSLWHVGVINIPSTQMTTTFSIGTTTGSGKIKG